jgi:hypothetical protein
MTRDDFDTGFFDGYVGTSTRFGPETITALAQANTFTVDDPLYPSAFRNAYGGTLQWTHDFNARSQLTAYRQYALLDYPGQEPRSANRYIGGVGYAHAFRAGDPVLYAGPYGGDERTRDSSFDYLGHQPIGLRFGGQKTRGHKWLLFFSGAYENRPYDGMDPSFLVTRKDIQHSVGLGNNAIIAWGRTFSPTSSEFLDHAAGNPMPSAVTGMAWSPIPSAAASLMLAM